MFIKATLLMLLGAAQAQNVMRNIQTDDTVWADINGRRPTWIDNTCPDAQVYSFITGRCIGRTASLDLRLRGSKPRCHIQERWNFNEAQCVRNCYPNRYFYPSDRGAAGGECYDEATLMEFADPLCQTQGKRYDVVEAMCTSGNRVPISRSPITRSPTTRRPIPRSPVPIYDYTIEERLAAEKRAHDAALAEADKRAADLKAEQEIFNDGIRK